ncbi:MAG: porin [Paraglaciecola sp.]|uniref:porin n=1 Tax=Paraglaciecola sp. TaxID=1920173 RepID=UPI003296AE3E
MKKLLTIAALTATTFAANAEVRINGFANLIGGISNTEGSPYGYGEDIGFTEESLFAIQISGDINEKMTATGQIVAKGEDGYTPSFEWAYMTYSATDNLSISAGRLRLPLFRYSSSLDVGYSYHWVNAPQAVYDVPFNNLDGIRLDYSNYAGDWEYNIQLAYGAYDTDTDVYNIVGNNTIVASAELTYEWLKLRGVWGTGESSLNLYALEDSLATLEQVLPADLYDLYAYEEDNGYFVGFGVEVDRFDWFVSAEITSVDTPDSYLREDMAYYVTAGLRLGKFTPSITYEAKESEEDFKYVDQISALPSAELQATLYGIQTLFDDDSKTITLGLRYDYDTNIALKADVSKYTDDLNEDNDATLVRFAVNYVF